MLMLGRLNLRNGLLQIYYKRAIHTIETNVLNEKLYIYIVKFLNV